MGGDMMPKEQYDFIKGIQDYMLIASNMDEHEAWDFGFRVWQFEDWLYKYMTENIGKADTPQNERSEFVKVSDRECPWCKAVCTSTDKYCHECGWHIADTPQTDEFKNFDRESLILLIEAQKERIGELLADKDTPQPDAEITRNSLRTDCNGCKFVGWYDTEFPCVNCTRKNKDYYTAEQTDCSWK